MIDSRGLRGYYWFEVAVGICPNLWPCGLCDTRRILPSPDSDTLCPPEGETRVDLVVADLERLKHLMRESVEARVPVLARLDGEPADALEAWLREQDGVVPYKGEPQP